MHNKVGRTILKATLIASKKRSRRVSSEIRNNNNPEVHFSMPKRDHFSLLVDNYFTSVPKVSQPVPRRADDLNDTMGNDLIMGEWGDDNIRTIREW